MNNQQQNTKVFCVRDFVWDFTLNLGAVISILAPFSGEEASK
jgi:hypothetical protein